MVKLTLVYCLLANPYLCRTVTIERQGGMERCFISAMPVKAIDGLDYRFTGVRCEDGKTDIVFIGFH